MSDCWESTRGAASFDLQQSEIRRKWKASEVRDRALNSVRLCEQTHVAGNIRIHSLRRIQVSLFHTGS